MIRRIKDFFARMSTDEGNVIRYRIIYAFCFVIHSFYSVLFACKGVTELMVFNIVSTVMYLTGLILLRNNKYTIIWLMLVTAEILSHGLLCGFMLGFYYQFSLYSLSMIPVTYFITYLDPKIKHPLFISSVIAPVYLIAIICSMEWSSIHEPAYPGFSISFSNSVARLNLFAAFMILVSFSVMFLSKINFDLKVLRTQNDTLDRLANYDQLTGLRNRNHIHSIFEQYIKSTNPYCVVLGDIDDFKHVNDTYGHSAGDDVLKTVSSIISRGVGDNGVVCRWGGEEILILVKGSTDNCIKLTEDILGSIRNTTVESGKYKIKVTMTFGLCDYSDAMNIEKLISLADKRLYIGKKNGKNRVVTKS